MSIYIIIVSSSIIGQFYEHCSIYSIIGRKISIIGQSLVGDLEYNIIVGMGSSV